MLFKNNIIKAIIKKEKIFINKLQIDINNTIYI